MKKFMYLTLLIITGFILVGCDSAIPSINQQALVNESSTTFTLEQLAQYNGDNGSTAYIAVDGVVYDVTDEFTNGTHQGIKIGGTDATAIFASSPHSATLLSTLPVVGTLSTSTTSTTTETTTETTNTTNNTTSSQTTSGETTTTNQTALPVFTLTELAKYTGAEGTTAYIAVNGVVYDVTNAFNNGTHQGIPVGGTDATSVFEASSHSLSILNSLPIVGSLEGYDLIYTDNTTNNDTQYTTNYDDDCDDDDEHDDDDDEYEDDDYDDDEFEDDDEYEDDDYDDDEFDD